MQSSPSDPETRDGEDAGLRLPVSPLVRIERSADRVARLEQLRGEYQESMIRRESRRAAAEISLHESQVAADETSDAREDHDVDAWINAEADAMLRAGWTAEQLAEFGFSPEIIAEAQRRHTGT